MKTLLFTYDGRISRSQFWMSLLYYVAICAIAGVLFFVLAQIIPTDAGADGFSVTGVKSIPFLIVTFATIGLLAWSGVCIGIKRFHDRNKSGWWILIQLVPVIGPFWYFVEAFCLKGTDGPNRFGADPLGQQAVLQHA